MSSKEIFEMISDYASNHTSCVKVGVGASFVDFDDNIIVTTANEAPKGKIRCNEKHECYKAMITGIYESCEETRKYCQARHAEQNLMDELKKRHIDPASGFVYVSRYPCVACASRLVAEGVERICYSGKQEVSPEVKEILKDVELMWFPQYDFEDNLKED